MSCLEGDEGPADDDHAVPVSPEPAIPSERLRFALDAGRNGIWNWHSGQDTLVGDRGLSALWGLSDDQQMSTALFTASLDPADAARILGELRRAAASDGPDRCQIEFRIRRRDDGSERWIALQGRRYGSESEGTTELVGMARDVTSRKRRDTHMHLLMREVTHRSKNLLAIIQAMARQTVKDSITAAEFEKRFSSRLRGLAASHDLLAARDWHGAGVTDLVRWQIGPVMDEAAGRITLEGPDVYLNPEAAQNIGLAINELASNAARHGALSTEIGRVKVSWSIDLAGTNPRRFRISWVESDGPEVAEPRRYGFGHKVVERLAARALDGDVALTFAVAGLRWSLTIPASFVLDESDVLRVN